MKNGATQKFIALRYGTTEANLHNWLKKNSLKRKELQSASRDKAAMVKIV